MAINAVGSTNGVDQLVQQLMKGIDTNRDKQVSTSEFTTFLSKLLTNFSGQPTTTSMPGASRGAFAGVQALVPGSYSAMAGFDTAKINDPNHTTLKYQFARAVQDLGLLHAAATENLQRVVDYLNQNGGHATVTGKDTIDFGDGHGPVDVIFDVGGAAAAWQF